MLYGGTRTMFRNIVGIISGGASGLGGATASYLVRHGARVVVADLPAAEESFEKLDAFTNANTSDNDVNGSLKFVKTDVTSEEDVSLALDMAENEFGEQVNVAINCAGVATARKTLSQKVNDDGTITRRLHSLEEFTKTITVNTIGSFNVARLASERMASRSEDDNGLRGCIINTASVSAYDGQVGQVAYAASKGGVVGMTLPMARDLAPLGIRVMTIAPGLFMTPLLANLPEKVHKQLVNNVPWKVRDSIVLFPNRLGNPIEYAQLVGSIIQNSYLNGETIRLDGALRMPP